MGWCGHRGWRTKAFVYAPRRDAKAVRDLPAVMREGLVRLSHLVGVLATLDCRTETVRGVEDLVHEAVGHGLLAALPRVVHQPAHREGLRTYRAHLDGDLVGGATDPAGADLESRPDVVCLLYTSDAADDLLCVDLG